MMNQLTAKGITALVAVLFRRMVVCVYAEGPARVDSCVHGRHDVLAGAPGVGRGGDQGVGPQLEAVPQQCADHLALACARLSVQQQHQLRSTPFNELNFLGPFQKITELHFLPLSSPDV